MSLLNRRGFLTGSLFATGFAIATLQGDILGEPDNDIKKSNLHTLLLNEHPDLDPDFLKNVADEFGEYEMSASRPYVAGAAAAGTYSAIKFTADENGNPGIFNRLGAGLAPPVIMDLQLGPAFATNLPDPNEIYNSIKAKGAELTDEQAVAVTRTVLGYHYVMGHGVPTLLPSAMTMITTELVEKQLDKQDINKQGPDDNDGPGF